MTLALYLCRWPHFFFSTQGDKLCPEKILSKDNKASVVGLIPCKSNIKAHTEMLRSVPFLLCVCKLVQCEDLHSLSLLYCVQCAGVWTHKGLCFQSQRVKPVGVPLFQWKGAKRPICSNPRSEPAYVSCWVRPIAHQVTWIYRRAPLAKENWNLKFLILFHRARCLLEQTNTKTLRHKRGKCLRMTC